MGVLTPYFTLHHCLDILFGPARPLSSNARLFMAMGIELLFEQLLDVLVQLQLCPQQQLPPQANSPAALSSAASAASCKRRRAARGTVGQSCQQKWQSPLAKLAGPSAFTPSSVTSLESRDASSLALAAWS